MMEHEHQLCGLKCLNRDLLADIASRLDGSTLAFAACTCSVLRRIAQDQRLWKQLCYSKWPSTSLPEAQQLLSSSTTADFHKFYADSYPLLSYQNPANNHSTKLKKNPKLKTNIYLSDYASFVDVYYMNRCVYSKVLDGITEAVYSFEENDVSCHCDDSTNDRGRRLLNSPFKLHLLNKEQDDIENEEVLALALASPAECHNSQEDRCTELAVDIRLSWVLLDRKKDKAINLSSWKPLLVQRSWPYASDYIVQFGSIIPVEEDLLPHELARCLIVARCRLTKGEEYPQWREISMRIEDLAGAHVDGGKSLTILNRALYCLRSTNHLKIKEGHDQFERLKKDLICSNKLKERLADCLCLSIAVTSFVIFCYLSMKSMK